MFDFRGSATNTHSKMARLIVIGGNGWIGSAICRAALRKGASVVSVSRSGAPSEHLEDSLKAQIKWQKSPESPDDMKSLLEGATGVVSTVGSFGNPPLNSDSMFQLNGVANATIAQNVADAGVQHFVFISAHQYPIAKQTLLSGYYKGKIHAEETIAQLPFESKTILRPGFVSGKRGAVPLYLLGTPLSILLRSGPATFLRKLLPDFIGDFMEPPVDVNDVALCAAAGGLGRLTDVSKSYLNGVDITAIAKQNE